MATPIPTPNHIIIWLDQHIGLLKSNQQLKTAVGRQVNPEDSLPTSPLDENIDNLIKFRDDIDQSFDTIPKNLKAFSETKDCLDFIGECLKKNQKIFFITSGSMGKVIGQEFIQKYSSLKTIYVFCGYYKAHLEWVDDCLDQGIDCSMYNFHTDLLVRLLRDVAGYFMLEGDGEINRDKQLAYAAIIYFGWAKLLLERANRFDTKQIFIQLKDVEKRIAHAEELIKQANGNDDDPISCESCQ